MTTGSHTAGSGGDDTNLLNALADHLNVLFIVLYDKQDTSHEALYNL